MSAQGGRSAGAVDAARQVIDDKQARKFRGVLLDMQTAHAIDTVANALSERNRERLNRMDIPRAAAIAWRLV